MIGNFSSTGVTLALEQDTTCRVELRRATSSTSSSSWEMTVSGTGILAFEFPGIGNFPFDLPIWDYGKWIVSGTKISSF